jgi:hypothetical protein
MNPTLLIFGIQATLRAAQAGADLYGEHARERKVFLPDIELPEASRRGQLIQFLKENPQIASTNRELSDIWDEEHKELKTTDREIVDSACTIMLQHKAKDRLIKKGKDVNDVNRESQMLAAGRMIEQWREERKPPSAIIRMVLTLTDIGLEFVASNPSLLGVGSRGEKLIVAFAKNMSALIPDDTDDFGSKTDFADRVLGIFLRSGLGTLASNASAVFKDEDIAKLLEGVTKPIVDALPESIGDQFRYRDLVDALAGPSAEAAFKLLAENTDTYLGRDFSDDKALGAVTKAFFEEITITTQDGSIVDVLSEQGLIRLYQASLGVAVERPGLFTGDDTSVKKQLLRDLLSGTAGSLRAHPRFKGPLGASLAAMVVDMVGHNAPALLKLNPEEPWEKVADAMIKQVTKGLADTLNDVDADGLPKGALKSFSNRQLLELGRVILTQIVQTPGMVGIKRFEVQAIVAGMAETMVADDNLLLSADEWIEIAGVAARKAASNPGRLFGLSADDPGEALAVTVIKTVLRVAGNAWTAGGREEHQLLFGETLQAVLGTVIEALVANVSALAAKPNLVDQFLQILLKAASANPEKFGSEGFLKVFRLLIWDVLASGTVPKNQDIIAALTA